MHTLKVGIGEGVSILVFLRDGSLLFLLSMEALFIPELEDVCEHTTMYDYALELKSEKKK